MSIVDTMVCATLSWLLEQIEHFTHNVRRATGLGRGKAGVVNDMSLPFLILSMSLPNPI
jgi:hypothetical protein